jgi:hypothetical protein
MLDDVQKRERERDHFDLLLLERAESNALIAVSVSLKGYVTCLAMAQLFVVSEALNTASFDSFPQHNNRLKIHLNFEIYAGQIASLVP